MAQLTIKFPKSNIEISGKLEIRTVKQYDGGEYGLEIEVDLTPLKQSKSGVYCIRNKFNGRMYIGMARNLENRYNRHWMDLLAGKHCSKEMQSDYLEWCKSTITEAGNPLYSGKIANISPSGIFEFEIIIYCRPSELTFYENILINNLYPEYNTKKKEK